MTANEQMRVERDFWFSKSREEQMASVAAVALRFPCEDITIADYDVHFAAIDAHLSTVKTDGVS